MQNNMNADTAKMVMSIILEVHREIKEDEGANSHYHGILVLKAAVEIAFKLCNVNLLKLVLEKLRDLSDLDEFDETFYFNIQDVIIESLEELILYLEVFWRDHPAVNGGMKVLQRENG